jgi:hypothetical protein
MNMIQQLAQREPKHFLQLLPFRPPVHIPAYVTFAYSTPSQTSFKENQQIVYLFGLC